MSHNIVGQAVGGREGSEPAIFQAGQAASIGADPERILVVFLKRPDFVVFQASGFHRERRETGAVEAHRAHRDGGMKKKQRRQKERVDVMAARLLLQEYLEHIGRPGSHPGIND